jgi:hypothetical protein
MSQDFDAIHMRHVDIQQDTAYVFLMFFEYSQCLHSVVGSQDRISHLFHHSTGDSLMNGVIVDYEYCGKLRHISLLKYRYQQLPQRVSVHSISLHKKQYPLTGKFKYKP